MSHQKYTFKPTRLSLGTQQANIRKTDHTKLLVYERAATSAVDIKQSTLLSYALQKCGFQGPIPRVSQ